MWYSETQRLGIKKCSPLAYHLESWGKVLWLYSMPFMFLSLITSPILGYFYGWIYLLLILIPLFMALSSMFMRGKSQGILERKIFKYDYESDTVWIDEEELKVE